MLSSFPRDVLDEILDLIESVSEGCPTYSYKLFRLCDYAQGDLNICCINVAYGPSFATRVK